MIGLHFAIGDNSLSVIGISISAATSPFCAPLATAALSKGLHGEGENNAEEQQHKATFQELKYKVLLISATCCVVVIGLCENHLD